MTEFSISRDVPEERVQSIFEACGDSDPATILKGDDPIGLVVYDEDSLAAALTGLLTAEERSAIVDAFADIDTYDDGFFAGAGYEDALRAALGKLKGGN